MNRKLNSIYKLVILIFFLTSVSAADISVSGISDDGNGEASAGSPAAIETNLIGDFQNSEAGFIPTPGSWVWNGFGGILSSNPYQLLADDGTNHIFAKGGDNGLWDNVDGDWQGLGGQIYSDPFALEDGQGNIHILAKGGNGALWDRIYDGNWWDLGGTITSNPSAALELGAGGYMYIVARGGDNALWARELDTTDMSGDWYSCDGYITSNPQIVFDSQGNWHTFVRGGDGALWDLNLIKKDDHFYEGDWHSLGGIITSDAMPTLDPFNPSLIRTSVRGSDGTLWYNTLDTSTSWVTATWTGLSGYLDGNPAPVIDTDGVLHNFVRGGDGGLWDNADGTWYNLGGFIKSNPNAIRDTEGKLHVAAVGGDDGLWVNTVGIDATPTTLVGSFACDYDKIQDGVDSISAGGIVKVLDGTYYENVQIDKSLTVKGAGKANTFVNGQLTDSVFSLINPSAHVSLLDMTIENGNAEKGGGIYNKGTLDLSGILLTQNSASNGGGIYNSGTLYLNDVSITENVAGNGGGLFSTNAQVTFDGSQVFVTNNRAAAPTPIEYGWYQGWGVYINSGMPITTGGFDPSTQVTGNTLVS